MPDPSEVAMSFVSFCILTIHHIGEYTIPSLLLVLASLWHSLGFLHLCLYPKNITVPHTRHQHGTYHHLLIHSQFLDVRVACHPQCQCQDKSLQHLISSRHLMSHHVWYLFKSVLLFFFQCPVPDICSLVPTTESLLIAVTVVKIGEYTLLSGFSGSHGVRSAAV